MMRFPNVVRFLTDSCRAFLATQVHAKDLAGVPRRFTLWLRVRWLEALLALTAILCAGSAYFLLSESENDRDPSLAPEELLHLNGFARQWHRSPATGREVKYYVYCPPHFRDQEGPFPLIVFLPGHGERLGAPQIGLMASVQNRVADNKPFEFVVLSPTSNSGRWRPGSDDEVETMDVLHHVVQQYRVDPSRIYLTGHSAAGCGVWELAEKHRTEWAALVPLCATCFPEVERVQGVPCWIFQGDRDRVVSVKQTRDFVEKLRQTGTEVRYTEIPRGKHLIWKDVYHREELFSWLAQKKR